MNASALNLKCDPVAAKLASLGKWSLAEVGISISGYFYAVDFGPDLRPQQHRVGKNAIWSEAPLRTATWASYARSWT